MRTPRNAPLKLTGQRARDLARLGEAEYLRRQAIYRERKMRGQVATKQRGLHDDETQSGGDIEESLAATRAYFRERAAVRADAAG